MTLSVSVLHTANTLCFSGFLLFVFYLTEFFFSLLEKKTKMKIHVICIYLTLVYIYG